MIEVKKDRKSACYMIVTTNNEGYHGTLFITPSDYEQLKKLIK